MNPFSKSSVRVHGIASVRLYDCTSVRHTVDCRLTITVYSALSRRAARSPDRRGPLTRQPRSLSCARSALDRVDQALVVGSAKHVACGRIVAPLGARGSCELDCAAAEPTADWLPSRFGQCGGQARLAARQSWHDLAGRPARLAVLEVVAAEGMAGAGPATGACA